MSIYCKQEAEHFLQEGWQFETLDGQPYLARGPIYLRLHNEVAVVLFKQRDKEREDE